MTKITYISSCQHCPFRDSNTCTEGDWLPLACQRMDENREIIHKVPDWCPLLEFTLRGSHVLGYRLRMRMTNGIRPCEFVYYKDRKPSRNVYLKDYVKEWKEEDDSC